MEILIYNSTNFLRLIISQYDKVFGLSATPVAYLALVSVPHCIARDWRAFSVLKFC